MYLFDIRKSHLENIESAYKTILNSQFYMPINGNFRL